MPPRAPKNSKTKKRAASIAQRGNTRKESRDKKNQTVTLSLRLPIPMLEEIDQAVKSRPYKMPRHMWLLEAVHEKLARLRQGHGNVL